MFYAINDYQFKTNNVKNVEKLVKQTCSSSLKALLEWTGNVHFCKIREITFLLGGP